MFSTRHFCLYTCLATARYYFETPPQCPGVYLKAGISSLWVPRTRGTSPTRGAPCSCEQALKLKRNAWNMSVTTILHLSMSGRNQVQSVTTHKWSALHQNLQGPQPQPQAAHNVLDMNTVLGLFKLYHSCDPTKIFYILLHRCYHTCICS